MSKEDKKLADEFVSRDVAQMKRQMQQLPGEHVVAAYDAVGSAPLDSHTFVTLVIGARGCLTRQRAREAAQTWLTIIRRSPQSPVYLQLLGYDDDPRDLWEIDEVRAHVCRFARFAGITEPADHRSRLDLCGYSGVGWLVACGVPSEFVTAILPPKTTGH